jgi:hypothetical protein
MDSSGFLSVGLMVWCSEHVCDVKNFTVSEITAVLIQVLRPYSLSSNLVGCIDTSTRDGNTVQ